MGFRNRGELDGRGFLEVGLGVCASRATESWLSSKIPTVQTHAKPQIFGEKNRFPDYFSFFWVSHPLGLFAVNVRSLCIFIPPYGVHAYMVTYIYPTQLVPCWKKIFPRLLTPPGKTRWCSVMAAVTVVSARVGTDRIRMEKAQLGYEEGCKIPEVCWIYGDIVSLTWLGDGKKKAGPSYFCTSEWSCGDEGAGISFLTFFFFFFVFFFFFFLKFPIFFFFPFFGFLVV